MSLYVRELLRLAEAVVLAAVTIHVLMAACEWVASVGGLP